MTVAPAVVSASVVKPTFVSCEPSPTNEVADRAPDDELNDYLLVFTFGPLFPTPVLVKIGKQSVSVVSLDTVIVVAVEAVPVIAPAAAIAPAKYDVPLFTMRTVCDDPSLPPVQVIV